MWKVCGLCKGNDPTIIFEPRAARRSTNIILYSLFIIHSNRMIRLAIMRFRLTPRPKYSIL